MCNLEQQLAAGLARFHDPVCLSRPVEWQHAIDRYDEAAVERPSSSSRVRM